jgi:hypothetical protein
LTIAADEGGIRSTQAMEEKLTDAEGHVFLTIAYDQSLGITRASWLGEQSDETVRPGASACLEIIRQSRSSKFLNDSSQITGTWLESNPWIAEKLIPEAIQAGLKYVAFVLPAGLEGKISIVDLHQLVGDLVQMKAFMSLELAEDWLKSVD